MSEREHRPTLDPSVLLRLADNMHHIGQAWERDVDRLNASQQQIDNCTREMHAASDRAFNVEKDLAAEREENRRLVARNAYLEAQCQRLFDLARNAQDDMAIIAEQAVEVARDAPAVAPRAPEPRPRNDGTTADRHMRHAAQPKSPDAYAPKPPPLRPRAEPVHAEGDDDDGLPPGRPSFLRTALPQNAFG